MEKNTQTHKDKRESWRYCGRSILCGRDPLGGGFSWPPRSYTCSFCRREFRSAQALGGHMNVHRRDRARLRLSPPWDSPPNPNTDSNPYIVSVPNLNMPPPSCSIIDAKNSPVLYTFHSLLSPLGDTVNPAIPVKTLHGVRQWESFIEDDELMTRKQTDQVRATSCDLEKNLDLELRLGYP